MSMGFQRGGVKTQSRGALPDVRGWLEDVGAVLAPQLLDGFTS
jgi:hypothetical protein